MTKALFIGAAASLLLARETRAAELKGVLVDEAHALFALSDKVRFSARFDPKGPRLIVELEDTRNAAPPAVEGKGGFVRRVTTAQSGVRTEAVLELAKSAAFDESWDGSTLILWLGDLDAQGAPPPKPEAFAPAPAPAPPPGRRVAVRPKPAAQMPAAPSPPPPPAKPSGGGRFMVQVGAFPTEAEAVDLKEALELEPSFSPAAISTRTVSGRVYFQVRLGPYAQRQQALAIKGKLAAIGRRAFVTEIP